MFYLAKDLQGSYTKTSLDFCLRHEPLFSHEPLERFSLQPNSEKKVQIDGIRLLGELTDVRHADSGSPDDPNLRGFLAS